MIDQIRKNIEGRLAEINREATTLQAVLDSLNGKKPEQSKVKVKRTMSAETRRKMSDAAKRRHARNRIAV